MRAARKAGVPVLLDGQGGDEILCGYKKFAYFYLRQLLGERRFFGALRHTWDLLRRGDTRLLRLQSGQRYLPAGMLRQSVPENSDGSRPACPSRPVANNRQVRPVLYRH